MASKAAGAPGPPPPCTWTAQVHASPCGGGGGVAAAGSPPYTARRPANGSKRMTSVKVLVQQLDNYPSEWPLPDYATAGSAAVDLRNAGATFTLAPLARSLVPTGLAIALPAHMEAQIRPRSGLALKRGISIINTPCTIDSDYRGEIRIPLINLDREPQVVEHGERIAQLLVAQVLRIHWEPTAQLPASERGRGGFGSTGR